MGRFGNRFLNALGFEEAPAAAYGEGGYEETVQAGPRERVRSGKKEKGKIIRMYDGETKILIYEPKEYEDAREIAMDLEYGRQAIVNVDGLENGTAQRIADFVGGAAYALKGQINWVTPTLFIAVPAEVEVETDGGNFDAKTKLNW